MRSRPFAGCRFVLVVVLCLGTSIALAGSTASAIADGPATVDERAELERDSVLLRVDVHENGTASWRVEYRTRLDEPDTAAAFESLQSDIEEDPAAYSEEFFRDMDETIATAERSTGREMSGENYAVDAETRRLPQKYGVVTYSFDWHGFAAIADDEVQVGDSLSGLFLGDDERLMISWPDGYEVAEFRPDPDVEREQTVVWTGPADFGRNEPHVSLAPVSTGPTVPEWLPVAVVVGCAVLAIAWWRRTRGARSGSGVPALQATDGGIAPDLLTNEERVLQMLEQHGGRVKQQDIVDELGWTEAKTSQVISTLREEGKVESFRLGRENVVSIPDTQKELP